MNNQPKILIIDDDERLGRTIKNVLFTQGYDVYYANNGASGIQKTFEYSPDLIICDIRMSPVDGYQVYNVLKESSLIDHIPFIFLTGNSELDDIRSGMDLGADDYFVKPINNDDLIRSIENRLNKFKKIKEAGNQHFRTLFKLSPNGIFLFGSSYIIDANPALLKILELNKEEMLRLSIEDIFEKNSLLAIKENIQRCLNGIIESFNDRITLVSKTGNMTNVSIFVSVYEKISGFSQLIGLVTLNTDFSQNIENEKMATEVLRILRRENIKITAYLGEKLAEVFNSQNYNFNSQNNNFFSKRENEVLLLSMEGLPTKLIADKLSISDRTVEKHRANLMEKTKSNNMIEVIVFALRNNFIRISNIFLLTISIF